MNIKRYTLFVLLFFLFNPNFSFRNHETVSSFYPYSSLRLKNSISDDHIDYLIITTKDFKSVIEPLLLWKTQKGLISEYETVENINKEYSGRNLPEKIKNCIKTYHDNNKTQWVVLAGDHQHIPSQYVRIYDDYSYDGDYVSCDTFYADLDNNWDLNNDGLWGTAQDELDFEAEVFIGRLSANNKKEMNNIVQKILDYEKIPVIGNWMTKAILASSILAFNEDWNNDNIVDFEECDGNRFNNFLNDRLPAHFNSTILALTTGIKGSNYSYNISLNYENFKNEVQKGFSIGSFSLHGSETALHYEEWLQDHDGDMLFDFTADPIFGNGTRVDLSSWERLVDTIYYPIESENNKLGILFLMACSTGTFDYYQDCLAEYFVKNIAIGCVAASYVAWAEDQWYEREHGGWFAEGLGFRFWEQLFKNFQPGKALALAKADYVSDRNISTELYEYPEWHDKTLKQYNYFGDPEIPIWLSIPKQLNITEITFNDDSTFLEVTADSIPVENTTITLTKDTTLIWKGCTDENGIVVLPYNGEQLNEFMLTLSKMGYIPYQFEPIKKNNSSFSIKGYNLILSSMILLGITSIYLIRRKRNTIISV